MRLLVDTNVVLDLLLRREPFLGSIRKLCVASDFGDVQLWVSTQSFADAYYVLKGTASEQDVKRMMLESLDFFIPCGTHGEDVRPGLESNWHDLEDYLVAYSSKHMDAAFFVTRDKEAAYKSPIPAMTPHSMIEYLEDELGLTYGNIPL